MKQIISVNVKSENFIELKELHDEWITVKNIKPIYIGKEGITDNKQEGDMKTPLGLFKLGPAFGFKKINTNYPFIKITENSYFVDDPKSKFYNKWVEVNGNISSDHPYILNSKEISWDSAEKLNNYPGPYEYGLIIEYNIPAIPNKGSAVFLHIKGKDYTAGCVSVNREDMLEILKWIDKDKNPHIEIKE